MTSIRKLLLTLFIVDIGIAILALSFFDKTVLLNMQIGFVSSSLVMIASFLSYRRMVNTGVLYETPDVNEPIDTIDKLEDPYDLYSENIIEEENKRSFPELIKNSKASLSIYRILAYVILVFGFFYLNRNAFLYLPAYLLALGLAPIVLLVVLVKSKNEKD
ncbi:MAG: hypothetical protein DRQ78_02215 [Epsilonproteobacteria bacterium]|nr:MAG: hypothetical protein DRQ78_02215 [Campylobacterota bacterium]